MRGIGEVLADPQPLGKLLQDDGCRMAGVVARRDRLAAQEHLRFEAVGLLHAIGALQVDGFGQDHIGIPGDIAEIDVDGHDEIQLVRGPAWCRLVSGIDMSGSKRLAMKALIG